MCELNIKGDPPLCVLARVRVGPKLSSAGSADAERAGGNGDLQLKLLIYSVCVRLCTKVAEGLSSSAVCVGFPSLSLLRTLHNIEITAPKPIENQAKHCRAAFYREIRA